MQADRPSNWLPNEFRDLRSMRTGSTTMMSMNSSAKDRRGATALLGSPSVLMHLLLWTGKLFNTDCLGSRDGLGDVFGYW